MWGIWSGTRAYPQRRQHQRPRVSVSQFNSRLLLVPNPTAQVCSTTSLLLGFTTFFFFFLHALRRCPAIGSSGTAAGQGERHVQTQCDTRVDSEMAGKLVYRSLKQVLLLRVIRVRSLQITVHLLASFTPILG